METCLPNNQLRERLQHLTASRTGQTVSIRLIFDFNKTYSVHIQNFQVLTSSNFDSLRPSVNSFVGPTEDLRPNLKF
ncbi:MAG: hypothetical protein ACTS80_02145 [Candidatus Hodgkinia cicadicola]